MSENSGGETTPGAGTPAQRSRWRGPHTWPLAHMWVGAAGSGPSSGWRRCGCRFGDPFSGAGRRPALSPPTGGQPAGCRRGGRGAVRYEPLRGTGKRHGERGKQSATISTYATRLRVAGTVGIPRLPGTGSPHGCGGSGSPSARDCFKSLVGGTPTERNGVVKAAVLRIGERACAEERGCRPRAWVTVQDRIEQ